MIKVFLSYAHVDSELEKELNEHLGVLRQEHIIETWHDEQIVPGTDWDADIARHLNEADLILLLISSAFLSSTYSYKTEMESAIKRHHAGAARVIPIMVRPCHWEPAPFAKLQGLPKNMIPVTIHDKRDAVRAERDAVWTEVAKGIHQAAQLLIDSRGRANGSYENKQQPDRDDAGGGTRKGRVSPEERHREAEAEEAGQKSGRLQAEAKRCPEKTEVGKQTEAEARQPGNERSLQDITEPVSLSNKERFWSGYLGGAGSTIVLLWGAARIIETPG
jgi:hypothetical protein